MIVYALPALVVWLSPWRFVMIGVPGRIGHLAVEVDYFLKRKALGEYGTIKPVLMLAPAKAANAALLGIWSPHFLHITNPVVEFLLRPLTYYPMLRIYTGPAIGDVDSPAHYPAVARQWDGRPPILQLPPDLIDRGEQALRAMGVPDGAWFVCVHVRDAVYSPNDEYIHGFRNSSIENCEPAVDAIIARGGWCIRMGESGTQPLRARKGVINYAASPLKSDWMDIFLSTRNRFFLGNTSGLCLISTIAGLPAALANMTPLGACYGMGPRDISIPKGLVRKDGSLLTLSDVFGSDIANFRYHSQFEQAGLSVVDNSAEQIRDLTLEMLDALDGKVRRSPEDEDLQRAFRSLFREQTSSYLTVSRIGAAYLRELSMTSGGAELRQAEAIPATNL